MATGEKQSKYREEAQREQQAIAKAAQDMLDAKIQARGIRPGCDTCRAFSVPDNTCRRRAPVMVPVPQQAAGPNGQPQIVGFKAMGLYPATMELEWCAEHLPWSAGVASPKPPLPLVHLHA